MAHGGVPPRSPVPLVPCVDAPARPCSAWRRIAEGTDPDCLQTVYRASVSTIRASHAHRARMVCNDTYVHYVEGVSTSEPSIALSISAKTAGVRASAYISSRIR